MPRRSAAALVLAWLTLLVPPAAANPGQRQLEAAYLYNLTQFIRWPDAAFVDARAPFRVCANGEAPLMLALELALAGGAVDGHPIVLEPFGDEPPSMDCRLVFVAAGRRRRQTAADLVLRLGAPHRLLVSDVVGFAAAGGSVELVAEGPRIALVINLRSLERDGLRAMANLLRLADVIRD